MRKELKTFSFSGSHGAFASPAAAQCGAGPGLLGGCWEVPPRWRQLLRQWAEQVSPRPRRLQSTGFTFRPRTPHRPADHVPADTASPDSHVSPPLSPPLRSLRPLPLPRYWCTADCTGYYYCAGTQRGAVIPCASGCDAHGPHYIPPQESSRDQLPTFASPPLVKGSRGDPPLPGLTWSDSGQMMMSTGKEDEEKIEPFAPKPEGTCTAPQGVRTCGAGRAWPGWAVRRRAGPGGVGG